MDSFYTYKQAIYKLKAIQDHSEETIHEVR
jgi:hypothetical protein